MASAIFNDLAAAISSLGIKSDGEVTLSELALIGTGEEQVILIQALGLNHILLPTGEIATTDGEVSSTFAPEVRDELVKYLEWRLDFAKRFEI